jgi:beta,beta-carotene 9',10'-dioxygenase
MTATTPGSHTIESIPPFRRSSEVREATPTVVVGQPPEWLRGVLVRTCPAVFEGRQWHARHWFDGLCMIYAFRIGPSSATFQSRLLESEAAHEIADGGPQVGSFATPTARTLLKRIVQPIQKITDNTNVNIVKMGEDLVALTEGSRQVLIDSRSLGARGERAYDSGPLDGAVMSAHPHFDFERSRVVNFATKFGANGTVSVYEHGGDERTRKVLGSWQTKRVPYLHSFGLSRRHAIIVAHPLTAKPLDMLWSNRGYIDHFAWHPQDGTRLVAIDRASGKVAEYETDPMFVFHTVNTFERDGDTVLDLLAYRDARIVLDDLRTDRMVEQLPDLRPMLTRIVLRPGRRRAELETLSDTGFEFPSTNYRRVSGIDYRFAWGAADGPREDGSYESSIVKVDVRSGAHSKYSDGERVYGEPVFVARPGGEGEDDGVLLSVGSSERSESSALAIIDAKTMALLASLEVPQAIPLGFHGSFARSNS